MKKNGFISTTLIYTFFILFLILMVFLLNNYSSTRFIVGRHEDDVEEELYELSSADINLYIYVWDDDDKEYKYKNFVPTRGFRENVSYCKNKSKIKYENGEIEISAREKDFCYVYFDAVEGSVTKPTIIASDGIASNNWHKDSLTLTFSGSKVENAEGNVIYYYGDSYSTMTNTGTSTSVLSEEGITSYYVKACSSENLELCSDIKEYALKIDKTNPSCTISLSGTSFVATYSDTGGSNINTTSSSSTTQEINSAGTYTFNVYDNANNLSSCSATVTNRNKQLFTKVSKTCNSAPSSYGCASGKHHINGKCYTYDAAGHNCYCSASLCMDKGCCSTRGGSWICDHYWYYGDEIVTGYSYSFGSETTNNNEESCTPNNIPCDSDHSGQTYVSCTSTGSKCDSGYTEVGNYCYKNN